jgi:3'-phosphoadenosine 5'-phosphosulfate sulfotransferase (PAPS reductase)/FAD synthetase
MGGKDERLILPGMPDALSSVPPKARDYVGMTLDEAIARTHALLDEVCERYPAQHIVALFSGGNDSTLLFRLLRERVTMATLVNTGIRVPDTARYVRDVAAAWGVELAEPQAPDSYRDLVCGRVRNKAGEVIWRGFPGPAAHYLMYQRLKERALDALRRELVGVRGKPGQAVYLAGMRWSESKRRFRNAEEIEPDGAIAWCSPVVHWTDGHISEYKDRHRCQLPHDHAEHMLCEPGSLPLNSVTTAMHMSGDCLCGAYAQEGEIWGWEVFYPDSAAEIHDIEAEARACGMPEQRCTWGWGAGIERPSGAGRLCSSCTAPQVEGQQELFPLPEGTAA